METHAHHEIESRHHFDDELDAIRHATVDLGEMVLANIRHASLVALETRLDEVDIVKAADLDVNEKYHELESGVFQILALQQPVATDLRFLVAATRILYELERSGDLAVNIVRQIDRLRGIPDVPSLQTIVAQLAEASEHMFALSIEAIATLDPDIGTNAEAEDEATDRLTADLFSSVTAHQDELDLEAAVGLFYIGRFFERIADHGVNIAENITFVVTGSFPDDG